MHWSGGLQAGRKREEQGDFREGAHSRRQRHLTRCDRQGEEARLRMLVGECFERHEIYRNFEPALVVLLV